jgi:threonine dehydrogenase-like Zn-dependent dehydrogenase
VTTMLAAKLHKIGEPMRLEQVPVPTPTRILGTARDRKRLARVKALAPNRIETLAEADGQSVADWARSFTGGHGVDAVIDCLGPGTSGTLLMNAIYALRRGGKAINIGGSAKRP